MMNIDNKYNIGDVVYLVTDAEQLPRIVTAITLTKYELIYEVYAGTVQSKHYDFELSLEKSYSFS